MYNSPFHLLLHLLARILLLLSTMYTLHCFHIHIPVLDNILFHFPFYFCLLLLYYWGYILLSNLHLLHLLFLLLLLLPLFHIWHISYLIPLLHLHIHFVLLSNSTVLFYFLYLLRPVNGTKSSDISCNCFVFLSTPSTLHP